MPHVLITGANRGLGLEFARQFPPSEHLQAGSREDGLQLHPGRCQITLAVHDLRRLGLRSVLPRVLDELLLAPLQRLQLLFLLNTRVTSAGIERLRGLETEGIVERRVLSAMPPWVEYGLTDKGRELRQGIEDDTPAEWDWTLDFVTRGDANTGVERIAVGAVTHSAPALDIGLDVES